MGWGISFALNDQGRVYCADGCKWRMIKEDYDGYPEWPSARQAVLDYFEGEAHRELDMIRDECPGTAAALRDACDEHVDIALRQYDRLSDEEKKLLHDETMVMLEAELVRIKEELVSALDAYKSQKASWVEYQKNPPKPKVAKTRADELLQIMEPYKIELAAEQAAMACDRLKLAKAQTSRMLAREKKFTF
jgi:hypothetical protein